MLWLENDGSVTPRKPTPILTTGSSNRVFLASAFAVSFPCFPKPNPRRPNEARPLGGSFYTFSKVRHKEVLRINERFAMRRPSKKAGQACRGSIQNTL